MDTPRVRSPRPPAPQEQIPVPSPAASTRPAGPQGPQAGHPQPVPRGRTCRRGEQGRGGRGGTPGLQVCGSLPAPMFSVGPRGAPTWAPGPSRGHANPRGGHRPRGPTPRAPTSDRGCEGVRGHSPVGTCTGHISEPVARSPDARSAAGAGTCPAPNARVMDVKWAPRGGAGDPQPHSGERSAGGSPAGKSAAPAAFQCSAYFIHQGSSKVWIFFVYLLICASSAHAGAPEVFSLVSQEMPLCCSLSPPLPTSPDHRVPSHLLLLDLYQHATDSGEEGGHVPGKQGRDVFPN